MLPLYINSGHAPEPAIQGCWSVLYQLQQYFLPSHCCPLEHKTQNAPKKRATAGSVLFFSVPGLFYPMACEDSRAPLAAAELRGSTQHLSPAIHSSPTKTPSW